MQLSYDFIRNVCEQIMLEYMCVCVCVYFNDQFSNLSESSWKGDSTLGTTRKLGTIFVNHRH